MFSGQAWMPSKCLEAEVLTAEGARIGTEETGEGGFLPQRSGMWFVNGKRSFLTTEGAPAAAKKLWRGKEHADLCGEKQPDFNYGERTDWRGFLTEGNEGNEASRLAAKWCTKAQKEV